MVRNHAVKAGDCIASIAFKYGFFPDTLWDLPENASLKEKRKDPHVLQPGDVVYVPDLRSNSVEGSTEARHRFRRKGVPQVLKVQIMGVAGPVADMPYWIVVDGQSGDGKTDPNGWLRHPIPPNARIARVGLQNGLEYELNLGRLDPVDEALGVQQRLKNLGYYDGPMDGVPGPQMAAALRRFQDSHDLEPTGEADDRTKQQLVDVNGG